MRKALFLATLASLLFAAPASSSERIIGGTPATNVGSAVALVEKGVNAYRGYFCSGTLIAPRWVLTARHCMEIYSVKEVDVIAGRKDLRSRAGERIAPVRVYYKSFNEENHQDVALLYLAKPSSQRTTPVSKRLPDVGKSVRIRGWGAKRLHYPRRLQAASVDVVSLDRCRQAYNWNFSEKDLLCAARENTDACWGDSGGPLLWKGGIVGIVSFGGVECADPNFPTAYAKVPGWVEWRVQHPPSRYKDFRPGPDTLREPRPFVLLYIHLYGNTETNEYQLYVGAQSNYEVLVARAKLQGPSDMLFCQELFCASSGEWFDLPIGSGRRHAETLFAEGNQGCPQVEFSVKLRHKKKWWRETTGGC